MLGRVRGLVDVSTGELFPGKTSTLSSLTESLKQCFQGLDAEGSLILH